MGFDDKVVIDRQAAKAVNRTTMYAAAIAQRNFLFYLLIALIILLIAIILFLLVKRRKTPMKVSEKNEKMLKSFCLSLLL